MHRIDADTVPAPARDAPDARIKVGAASLITMMAGLSGQAMIFALPGPLLQTMAQAYGAHGQAMAQMQSAFASLGLMFAACGSGLIVRAMGVRPMLIFALILYGVAGSVPAITTTIPLLLGSRLLVGAGCGLLTTGCTLLLAHGFAGAARSRVIGYQTASSSITGLVVVMIVGAILARSGWQLPFLLYGIAALPIALLAIAGVPHVPLPPQTSRGGFGHAVVRIWPICLAGCLLMMVPLIIGSNGPFLLAAIGVTAPVLQSLIIASYMVMSALGGALFGRCQMALGPPRTFILSLLLAAAGMMCAGLATTGLMVAGGYMLVGFASGLFLPHLWLLSTSLVAAEMQGYAIGLLTTAMFLGGFLYPFLIGPLQLWLGLPAALAFVGALLAAAAIFMSLSRGIRLAGATPRLA